MEQFFYDFLVNAKVFLIFNVTYDGYVEHGAARIVLLVDVGTEAQESLDVVFLKSHDGVVERRSAVEVADVWVETIRVYLL